MLISMISHTELWVAGPVYAGLGLKDDLDGHVSLAQQMPFSYLGMPAGHEDDGTLRLNYRRFSPSEAVAGSKIMPTCIIVDGPFGRRVSGKGLLSLFPWNDAMQSQLAAEAARTTLELSAFLKSRPKIVVIADDIAFQQGTYISPADLRSRLFPFYRPMIDSIHQAKAQAVFHSDGNLAKVFPDLIETGFDGFACQTDCNRDALKTLKGLLILGGIDTGLLSANLQGNAASGSFITLVNELKSNHRLVLCSSSGISSLADLHRLQEIYSWVE